MAIPPPSARSWLHVALLGGAVAVGLAVAVLWLRPDSPRAPAPSPLANTATQTAPQRPAASATPPRPSFDAVVVAPDGGAVLAGRAQPGASVVVHDGDRVVGTAQADGNGNWVITPTEHLQAGPHALTLSENLSGGGQLRSDTPALVEVPKPAEKATAETVLAPPGGAPVVMHQPGAAAASAPTLEAVAYGAKGAVTFTGRAPPGAHLQVYVDNRPAGIAQAGPDGTWSLTASDVAPGHHDLRLDQLTASGTVAARTALPFERAAPRPGVLAGTSVTIQPGTTLWQIAREAYGEGPRYVAIYHANHAMIRDPNLIYPGQVFTVPVPQPSRPASSSTSR